MSKKKFGLGYLLIPLILLNGGTAMSAQYRLHLIDASGSMMLDHKEDGGEMRSRFWWAQKMAKDNIPRERGGIFNGIYYMAEDDNHFLTDPGWLEDSDAIKTEIDALTCTYDLTPLADGICDAMETLENVGNDTDERYLYIYTDGNENYSYETICANNDVSVINTALFQANSKRLDSDNTAHIDVLTSEEFTADRETWLLNDTPINATGGYDTPMQGEEPVEWYRSYEYQAGSGFTLDWSGGVLPHSWEWRMYYRATWGTAWANEYESWATPNAEWDSKPNRDKDVILNVLTIYQKVDSGEGGGSRSFARSLPAADNPDVGPMYPVVRSENSNPAVLARSTPTYVSMNPTESSLFAGLTVLTGGKYSENSSDSVYFLPADLDKDGVVGESDLRAVITWFGRPVDIYCPESIEADVFTDGFIDNNDMMFVISQWTDLNKYPPIVGDTDYNWCVDQSDLNKIWQWFGRTPGSGDQEFYHADLNADGVVDYDDVLLYWEHAGEGCGTNGIPTCNDGIQYGEETDVDCGGSICAACGDGQSCLVPDDCLSNVCEGNICIGGGAASEVEADIIITNDWVSGYCANISVTNNAGEATSGWTVELDMNGGTINQSWSGNFSGNVTVTNAGWNGTINPGDTIQSAGFCASRNGGGTADVVSATGIF